MKTFITLMLMCFGTSFVSANIYNATNDIPTILPYYGWEKIADVAQYKKADWSQVIGQSQNITLGDAQRIANSDPRITYFFHVKGDQMVLENYDVEPPLVRVFHHGDAVFFTGTPHWGTAPDLSDGYVKIDQ